MTRSRKILLMGLILFAACSSESFARNPKLRWSLDWGWSAQMAEFYHYSFRSPMGSIYDRETTGKELSFNGSCLAGFNHKLGNHFEAGIYAGYSGLRNKLGFFTLCTSFYYYPCGVTSDGFLLGLNTGGGFGSQKGIDWVSIGRINAGYRYCTGEGTSIDFKVSARLSVDHPQQITDSVFGEISSSELMSSKAFYAALGIGVSFNF